METYKKSKCQNTLMLERKKLLVFFGLGFTLLSVLIYNIFKPMMNTILLGFVFSFLMYPLFKIINHKIKKPKLSSFIVCLLFVLVITTPVLIGINNLAQEVFSVGKTVSDSGALGNIENYNCSSDSIFCDFVNKLMVESNFKDTIKDIIKSGLSTFSAYIGNLLFKLPSLVLNIFMIIFMMYYLLIDGKKFVQKVYNIIPISNTHKHKLFKKTFDVLGGILFGNLAVAVIQGVLTGIGFAIFGFNAPFLWGILTMFFALIPMLGAGIVWFPASMYMIISSLMVSNMVGVWQGVGLMVYGAIIVSTLDNFIRPMLVSDKTNIHPVLVLFGVIGGLSVFGTAGIFIGPLILGMFLTLVDMYEDEKNFLFNSIDPNTVTTKSKKIKNAPKEIYYMDNEKMPDGLSCIMTKKDYNLLQEYKKSLNLTLNDYFKKLNIPIIKYSGVKNKKGKNKIKNTKKKTSRNKKR